MVVCQRNERKTENGRRRQNFGEILVKTLKNRNTGLFEPIGGCGPTNMTNGGGMNMVVLLESDRNSHPKASRINQSESDRNSQS